MIQTLSRTLLQIFGWKVDMSIPSLKKYILIGAPHTTNWDFPLALLSLTSMGIKFNWVAKHTLFWWPLGPLFRAIGGIPVDRSSGAGFLKNSLELFRTKESLILAIAPEGTRSKAKYWKTGFYTIAEKTGVPIALGYINYEKKVVGIGEVLAASGDIEEDFKKLRQFYHDKVGKIPANQGEVRCKNRRSRNKKGQ